MAFLGKLQQEDAQLDSVAVGEQSIVIRHGKFELNENDVKRLKEYLLDLFNDILEDLNTSAFFVVNIIEGEHAAFEDMDGSVSIGYSLIKKLLQADYYARLDRTISHELFHKLQKKDRSTKELDASFNATYNKKFNIESLSYRADPLEYEANIYSLIFLRRRLEKLKKINGFDKVDDYEREILFVETHLGITQESAIPIYNLVKEIELEQANREVLAAVKWIQRYAEQTTFDKEAIDNFRNFLNFVKGVEAGTSYFYQSDSSGDNSIIFFRDNYDSNETFDIFVRKFNEESDKTKLKRNIAEIFLTFGFKIDGEISLSSKNSINLRVIDFKGDVYEVAITVGGVVVTANTGDVNKRTAGYIAEKLHTILVNYK